MTVHLTPELEQLVQNKIQSGRYNSASEVVQEALLLIERKDDMRAVQLQEFRNRIDNGLNVIGLRTDDDANELRWAADVVQLALDDDQARVRGDGTLASMSSIDRARLADRVPDIETRHAELWIKRSRPGGLVGSRRWFTRLREANINGTTPDGWPYPQVDLNDGERV